MILVAYFTERAFVMVPESEPQSQDIGFDGREVTDELVNKISHLLEVEEVDA